MPMLIMLQRKSSGKAMDINSKRNNGNWGGGGGRKLDLLMFNLTFV